MIELRAAHITLCKPVSDDLKQDPKRSKEDHKACAKDKAAKVKGSEKDKAVAESTKPGTEAAVEAPPMKGEEQIPHTHVKVELSCVLCKAVDLRGCNVLTLAVAASAHSAQLGMRKRKRYALLKERDLFL